MAPIVKTFNCVSNSTPIEPLKRPYYCCGWYKPPKSFSGIYKIYRTGNPSGNLRCGVDDICTGPQGIPIKLELENECGDPNVSTYLWKSNPNYLVYAFRIFRLCALPDGSDAPTSVGIQTVFKFEDPYEEGDQTYFECSYNLTTKEYKFRYKNLFFVDFGNGDTFFRETDLDTVEME